MVKYVSTVDRLDQTILKKQTVGQRAYNKGVLKEALRILKYKTPWNEVCDFDGKVQDIVQNKRIEITNERAKDADY